MASEAKGPPPRRTDDLEERDYRLLRRSYPSLKQTLGSLAMILVPILFGAVVALAVQVRSNDLATLADQARAVDRKADEAKAMALEAQRQAADALKQQAASSAQAQARWEDIQASLRRIEGKLK